MTEEERKLEEVEQNHRKQAKKILRKLWDCEKGTPVTLTQNESYELLYYIASIGGLKALWG